MPFDLSEVCFDLDLGQPLVILRSKGAFAAGGWKSTQPVQQIPEFGIITVASDKALQMIPEMDQVTGALLLITQAPIYTTHLHAVAGVPGPGLSDEIVWNEHRYSVISISPWKDFGYYAAVMLRLAGN